MNAATKTWTTAVTLAALLSSTAGTLAQSRPPWEAGAAPDAGAAAAAPPGQTIPGAGPVPGQVQMPAPAMSMAPAATGMPASTLLGATRSGTRPGESLGLTQKAWEDPEKHMGRGQTAPGYRRLEWAANRILPVNTREGLITTIAWPASENVVQVIVSDPASFEAAPSPDKHAIAVKPIYPGVDGNLVVYGSSGKIYNVYLKSTSYNDPTLSDMRVSVDVPSEGAESGDAGGGTGAGGAGGRGGSSTAGVRSDDPSDALTRPRARGGAIGRDFAATAATGPGRLRTDLEIMVSDPADSIIAPVAAWRDDKFTYLDYGPRAASMNVWPVASLVVDQVESPVGTRVAGPNRSVLVVEALGDVVLRNGTHVVCVKLDVVNHDNRKPAADEVYRDRPGLQPVVAAVAAATPPVTRAPATGLVTGPWRLDRALALASDIVVGYHGKIAEADVHVTSGGRALSREEILKAPATGSYDVRIDGDGVAPEKVCSDLRKSHRPCRLL